MTTDLAAALDALCEAEPALLGDGETVQALHRAVERLRAVTTRATAAFDASRAWEAEGARSAVAWVRVRCGLPAESARREVRLGRALRHMPDVEAAWLAGARSWVLDGLLDPISGGIVAKALGDIEHELFLADWSAAKARLGDGREVRVSDLARTPAQRRADALVEMARRSQAVPAGARVPEPLFTVLVGYETFRDRICQLGNGTVVTPASLAPWLGEASVERVVFDGPDRVKNVGVRRRVFAGATRRAVEVRDQECFHEFCDVPATECEIDHVQPWSEGGPTTDDNGRPACGYHNRLRHRRGPGP